jgi:hypothetical protein
MDKAYDNQSHEHFTNQRRRGSSLLKNSGGGDADLGTTATHTVPTEHASRQKQKQHENHSEQQQQQPINPESSLNNKTHGGSKKLDRILANRRSARRSRERRKQLQDNLEKSVFFLTKQNQVLSRENEQLKDELGHLMDLYNKISLDVLATLENNKNMSRRASAVPTACLPPNNNLASLQELLLYVAALSNNNNNNGNGDGFHSAGTTILPLHAGTGISSSIAPANTFNTIPSSNTHTFHFPLLNVAGSGSGLGGMGVAGVGGNHAMPTGVLDSTNFAYSGGIMDPSYATTALLSSLQYNDNAPMGSLHSGQQQSFTSIFNGATNNVRRGF